MWQLKNAEVANSFDYQSFLNRAAKEKKLPAVLAYNRIDGPGSTLDLPQFQRSLFRLPKMPDGLYADPSMEWTRSLPRTIGMTIDIGTKIYAEPFERDFISVQSVEYATEATAHCGEVLPLKQNWLLKILDLFSLRGVRFVLHNLRPGVQSSGLGGSASATIGVCILANELTGRPFEPVQLIAMASVIEHEFGVSMTGTQEQSNVIYGGARDYIWFPWGIPGSAGSGYGSSIQTELVRAEDYDQLERRVAIFHTGLTRASKDVNAVWVAALGTADGRRLHAHKLDIAYHFREALRLGRWNEVSEAIKEYQEVRVSLCKAYMDGAHEIQGFARERNCVVFPLGAGGGGGVLVFGADPDALATLRHELSQVYREINFKIQPRGHEILNLD